MLKTKLRKGEQIKIGTATVRVTKINPSGVTLVIGGPDNPRIQWVAKPGQAEATEDRR